MHTRANTLTARSCTHMYTAVPGSHSWRGLWSALLTRNLHCCTLKSTLQYTQGTTLDNFSLHAAAVSTPTPAYTARPLSHIAAARLAAGRHGVPDRSILVHRHPGASSPHPPPRECSVFQARTRSSLASTGQLLWQCGGQTAKPRSLFPTTNKHTHAGVQPGVLQSSDRHPV